MIYKLQGVINPVKQMEGKLKAVPSEIGSDKGNVPVNVHLYCQYTYRDSYVIGNAQQINPEGV